MNFQHLKYFESLYRNNSFTKAAEELNISQPALSNQIKTLEGDLGLQLFERTTREVVPTESSQVLYQYISKILRDINNLYNEIEDIKETGSGTISIGAIESSKKWFPYILKKFNAKYPNIQFALHEMSANNIEESISNYDIHFGITTNYSDSHTLEFITIYQEELILITSTKHSFKYLKEIDFINLKDENLIQVKPGYQLKNTILEAHELTGLIPAGQYVVEKLETARSLVEADLAVALVPENYLLYSSIKNLHLVKVKNPTPTRKVHLVYHKQRHLTPAVQYLISLIQDFFSDKDSF